MIICFVATRCCSSPPVLLKVPGLEPAVLQAVPAVVELKAVIN